MLLSFFYIIDSIALGQLVSPAGRNGKPPRKVFAVGLRGVLGRVGRRHPAAGS